MPGRSSGLLGDVFTCKLSQSAVVISEAHDLHEYVPVIRAAGLWSPAAHAFRTPALALAVTVLRIALPLAGLKSVEAV